MDKSICGEQINQKPIPQSSCDNFNYKIPQPIGRKIKNKENNNKNNNIDYKNVLLSMTGEISSDCIHRNNLTQKQPNVTFIQDTEDDDEQFILDMKAIIDKNHNIQNKENFSIRDLQSKSYLAKKKKCVFSDEDQNLIKRFKKSIDKNETSRKPQQSEHSVSVSHKACSTTPQITSIVKNNNVNFSFRNSTNELLFHAISKTAKNNQSQTPGIGKIVTEVGSEELIYHEIYEYFTPPQKDDQL